MPMIMAIRRAKLIWKNFEKHNKHIWVFGFDNKVVIFLINFNKILKEKIERWIILM